MPAVITHLGRRAADLQRRSPVLADVALVAALLLTLAPARVGDVVNGADARLFGLGLIVPLVARRRWPVAIFALVSAIAAAQWLADVRTVGDVAVLVALYGVALTQPLPTVVACAAVVEAGIVLAAVRWGSDGTDTLHALIGLTGLATAATVMGTSTRNRRALVLSLQERAERLEVERDQQGRLAAADERARIARELHDVVAHNVSVMIALADGATYAVGHDPARARHAMEQTSTTGRQALTEMRRLLGVLREDERGSRDLAPQPGLGQLDALLHQVRTAGLPVSYTQTGAPSPLPAGLQLAIYRIVQEALTNTLKHAGSGAAAQLHIAYSADELHVDIADHGGEHHAHATSAPGAGLRGINERASVYDGSVDIGPEPGGGWRVRLRIPLQRQAVPA